MKYLSLIIFLTGCQSSFIKLAEVPGEYVKPVDKNEYVLTAYGWYINKQIKIDYPKIDYQVLIDNRKLKAGLMAKYEHTEHFKKEFPWFIKHKGKVNCASKENSASIEFLDEKLDKVLKETPNAGMNEVASALCLLSDLSEEL